MRGLLAVVFSVIFLSVSGQINPTGFGKLQLGMNIRDLHLDSLVVNDVLTLHDISLSFYKGKLYKIEIGEDLSDILILKYGSYEPYLFNVDQYGHMKDIMIITETTKTTSFYVYYSPIMSEFKWPTSNNSELKLLHIWSTSNNTCLFTYKDHNLVGENLNWINKTILYKGSIMEKIELEDKVRLEKYNENKRLEEEKVRIEQERIQMERNKKLLEGF